MKELRVLMGIYDGRRPAHQFPEALPLGLELGFNLFGPNAAEKNSAHELT
jgi:hypothetical protein